MPVKPPKIKDIITGEKFKYEVYPEPSPDASYIINTRHFQMYIQHGKAYIYWNSDTTEIDKGCYNSAIQQIAGLTDEAAIEKVKDLFRAGKLKKAKYYERKLYERR